MIFNKLLDEYRQCFSKHSSFKLKRKEKIRTRARAEDVPNEPGVYLIYGQKEKRCELLYIGKAGTLRKNGMFKSQKLIGRLSAKQKGMSRQKFYQEQIKKLNLDTLIFYWFVTFADSVRVIPAKAEIDLLQAYFGEYNKLPQWNESV